MLKTNKRTISKWRQISMGKCIQKNNNRNSKVDNKDNKNQHNKKWGMSTNNRKKKT